MATISGDEAILTHSAQEVDDNIDEVVTARGSEASLNAALTAIKNPLADLIDSGAKNIAVPRAIGTPTSYTVVTNSDGSLTFTVNTSSSNRKVKIATLSGGNGDYVFSGCTGGSRTTYRLSLYDDSDTWVDENLDGGTEYSGSLDGYSLYINMVSSYSGTFTIKPMVCTKAAWNISNKYVQYKEDFKDVTGTLAAGSTSLTISDSAIKTSSDFDFFTDTFGVNPTAVSVSAGSITLTFESQVSAVKVKVRVWN